MQTLGKKGRRTHTQGMSVAGILPLTRQLSPEEKAELIEALENEITEATDTTGARKPLKWPDGEARRKRILGDRVLPNLVLQAREEERY